jgi:hypothetical protein
MPMMKLLRTAYSSSSILDHTDRFERKDSPGLYFLSVVTLNYSKLHVD